MVASCSAGVRQVIVAVAVRTTLGGGTRPRIPPLQQIAATVADRTRSPPVSLSMARSFSISACVRQEKEASSSSSSSSSTTSSAHRSSTHPSDLRTGLKSTLPSSASPLESKGAFDFLLREEKEEMEDGDRGYLAFTKASLFKLTLPLFPPDRGLDPQSPTSKASSALSRRYMDRAGRSMDEGESKSKEEQKEKGESISPDKVVEDGHGEKKKGESHARGTKVQDGPEGLHHAEGSSSKSDVDADAFDSKAPARSVMFLLHSGQPLSYVSSLIRAEEPSYTRRPLDSNEEGDPSRQYSEGTVEHKYEPSISFHTRKRDAKRWSPATGIGDFLRDAARVGSFVIKIGDREVVVSVPSFDDRTRFLRAAVSSKTARIEHMARLKGDLDKMAHQGTRRLAIGGACVLGSWMVGVTYATFFTSLRWEVMEPVSYLVGLATIFAGYLFVLARGRDVSYRAVINETTTRRQQHLYLEHGFRIERYQELIDEVKELRRAIKLVAEDYDLEWDQGDTVSGQRHKKALEVVRKSEARDEGSGKGASRREKEKEEEEDEEEEEEESEGEEDKDEDQGGDGGGGGSSKSDKGSGKGS